jgi:hypothetical protein
MGTDETPGELLGRLVRVKLADPLYDGPYARLAKLQKVVEEVVKDHTLGTEDVIGSGHDSASSTHLRNGTS